MKTILQFGQLVIMLLVSSNLLHAQDETVAGKAVELKAPPTYKNSSVNVEFLGSNRYYALNFEQILYRKGIMNLYASAGGTYMPPKLVSGIASYQVIGYNVEAGAMLGNRKNKLEVGLGYGFSYRYYGDLDLSFPVQRKTEMFDNHKLTFATFKLGYRHYFKNDRLYVRVATSLSYRITNSFVNNNACGPIDPWLTYKVLPMAGIGVGYAI